MRVLGFGILLAMIYAATGAGAQAQIVAFGTSFTNGKGVASSQTYPSQLQAMLRAKGYNVTVANEGIDGDGVRDGLARVDISVPNGTALAIVEFGVNEFCTVCSGNHMDFQKDTAIQNLKAIVARLHARGIKVILIGIQGVPIKQVARKGDGILLGGPLGLTAPQYQLGDSQRHLNGAGYAVIAAALEPMVERMIGKP